MPAEPVECGGWVYRSGRLRLNAADSTVGDFIVTRSDCDWVIVTNTATLQGTFSVTAYSAIAITGDDFGAAWYEVTPSERVVMAEWRIDHTQPFDTLRFTK